MRIYLSPPEVSEADIDAVSAAMRSGWVAPAGPDLRDFEHRVADLSDRRFAVALSSGTAALHLALKAAGVGPGDLVIVPTLSFAAPAFAVRYCGAEPFWVDVNPGNWQLNPTLLQSAIVTLLQQGRRIGAVIGVDLYGQCGDWDRVTQICETAGVPFIEDAAEALGASLCLADNATPPAGSWGQSGVFSFNGNKILTTSGGGVWVGDDEGLANKIRKWASQSREPVVHYEHQELGYNYRLSNLLAALGVSQLKVLAERIAKRRAILECYRRALEPLPGFSFMPIPSSSRPNYWLTCLQVDKDAAGISAREIQERLYEDGIECRPLWKPLHMQPIFAGTQGELSGTADALYAMGLCLPSGSGLRSEEQSEVIERILSMT